MSLASSHTVPSDSLACIDDVNKQAWELRHSKIDQALTLAQKAFELSKSASYLKGQAESLLTQGFCQLRRSDYKLAFQHVHKALEYFQSLSNEEGQQRTLNTLGILYAESGNLPEALKHFLKSLKLCESLSDQEGQANAYNNIAIIYSYLGDFPGALDTYFKSLDIARKTKSHNNEARVLLNIGLVDLEAGQYKSALEYFLKSLELQTDSENTHMQGQVLSNISRAYNHLNEHHKALEHANQALQIMESLGDKSGASYALDELGRAYFATGNLVKADAILRQSFQIKREVGDPKGHAQSCLILSEVLLKQKNYLEAITMLHEALFEMKRIDAKVEIYRLHQALARAYKLNGQYYEAMMHMESFIEIKEKVFNQTSDQRQQALRVRYEVAQAEKELEIFKLRSNELTQINQELQRLTIELDKQAHEDPLTGLYNRRHFNKEIERELNRARRFGSGMSVMICDIDNFKRVNDAYSHQVGDEVLVKVAQIFREHVRNVDTVARYGGEEFVILFPEINAEESFKICDRLRDLVEKSPWETIHPELAITISMGICDDISLLDADAMISAADLKLYEAKENGKNQVRF